MSTLQALRDGVVAGLTAALPGDVAVETHPGRFDLRELERVASGVPAVRVAILNAVAEHVGGGYGVQCTAELAAYIVARSDRHAYADERTLMLASLILPAVNMNRWGIDCHPPTQLRAANLFSSEMANKWNAHLAAVTWSQDILLGEVAEEPGELTREVWLGYEPEVFPADYDKIIDEADDGDA